MKVVFTVLAATVLLSFAFATKGQDIQRYSYHVWGTVLDEDSRPMPHINVCFVPAERPIQGVIPCTPTDNTGAFALTVRDIPDKYVVCATTTNSVFLFMDDKDPTHRVSCSKRFEFPANDDCRKVGLKFETKTPEVTTIGKLQQATSAGGAAEGCQGQARSEAECAGPWIRTVRQPSPE